MTLGARACCESGVPQSAEERPRTRGSRKTPSRYGSPRAHRRVCVDVSLTAALWQTLVSLTALPYRHLGH